MEKPVGLYFGGIPTGPDVQKLLDAFGVPEPGKLISHEEIGKVLGISKTGEKANRYRSIVGAWRRVLRATHNVVTEAPRNEGILILDPSRRVRFSSSKLLCGFRRITDGVEVARTTRSDGLSDAEKKQLEINARAGLAATAALKAEAKRKELTPAALPVSEQIRRTVSE